MENIELTWIERWLLRLSVIFGILGVLVFIISFFIFHHGEEFDSTLKINSEKFGDYGSFLSGVVGSVWALVSVILFYLTLRLQRKELSLQRNELELTRNELQGQKDQMIQQNRTLLQQQFESTFFQLISVHLNIVSSMDLRSVQNKSSVISEGRDCFEIFYKRLKHYIETQKANSENLTIIVGGATFAETINGYNIFYSNDQNNLGHYFRNLYNIIKFVDQSEIQNKKTYTNFVRAQLSSHELAILFYNCLSEYGSEKFKPLIEKYALLKNMNPVLIFNKVHLKKYQQSAYGK